MNVSIINIGDELLIGQVVNTNAATMSRLLIEAGMDVRETRVVGDRAEEIRNALDETLKGSDCVLLTGGLGPTKDDITKHLLCEYYGSSMVESPTALENVRRIFESRGFELTPVNRAQALVPACCEVLNNDTGTAPCMWFEGESVVVAMPGVPYEMEWLMRNRVIPRLKERFSTEAIISKNILTQGIGESFLSDLIEEWETALPKSIRLAYLPVAGMVKLRLTGRSRREDAEKLKGEIEAAVRRLYEIAGQYIVGEDSENLEELVHRMLSERGETLSTAESCTGGNIAARLTAMPGASAYYRGGVVAYSNEIKECMLGVSHDTLQAHGAVSEETVREMVNGVREKMQTDYAVATTGVAGPGGGTAEKPVGTVWVAACSKRETIAELMHFGNSRKQTVERSTNQAYAMLIRLICRED